MLTLVLFTFMASWNEFLLPLVMVTDENLRTAPSASRSSRGSTAPTASVRPRQPVIISAPIIVLFLFFSRSFIQGMATGAVKE